MRKSSSILITSKTSTSRDSAHSSKKVRFNINEPDQEIPNHKPQTESKRFVFKNGIFASIVEDLKHLENDVNCIGKQPKTRINIKKKKQFFDPGNSQQNPNNTEETKSSLNNKNITSGNDKGSSVRDSPDKQYKQRMAKVLRPSTNTGYKYENFVNKDNNNYKISSLRKDHNSLNFKNECHIDFGYKTGNNHFPNKSNHSMKIDEDRRVINSQLELISSMGSAKNQQRAPSSSYDWDNSTQGNLNKINLKRPIIDSKLLKSQNFVKRSAKEFDPKESTASNQNNQNRFSLDGIPIDN